MTTSKEQEAFGLVLERHKSSASENDIQACVPAFHGNGRSRRFVRDDD